MRTVILRNVPLSFKLPVPSTVKITIKFMIIALVKQKLV